MGLLLFLDDVKRRFGLHPVISNVHVQKLVCALRSKRKSWGRLGALKLWIITMGLLEATQEMQLRCLVSEWRKTLLEAGNMGQSEAEGIIKGVMWIESIHGKRYTELRELFWGDGGAAEFEFCRYVDERTIVVVAADLLRRI